MRDIHMWRDCVRDVSIYMLPHIQLPTCDHKKLTLYLTVKLMVDAISGKKRQAQLIQSVFCIHNIRRRPFSFQSDLSDGYLYYYYYYYYQEVALFQQAIHTTLTTRTLALCLLEYPNERVSFGQS